jgi:ankyrin repeat protein
MPWLRRFSPRDGASASLPVHPLRPDRARMKKLLRLAAVTLALTAFCAHAQMPCCAPSKTPEEALFRSIEDSDMAQFMRLVDAGVHRTAKNKLGETPLYVAAEKGQLEMARLLLGKGADARALTPNGETVLHAASMIESTALMAALIEAGADVNAANRDGETPLYWAAMTGTFLAVKAFVDAGADLNVQDTRVGNTPLHAAAWHNDIVLVHYLLSKNVRTDVRNNGGLTALELAKAGGRTSAVRLLQK